MIVINMPTQEQQPREVDPKQRRLVADLHQIEQTLRVLDLETLQDLIDTQIQMFPEWAKQADPHVQRAVVYTISTNQIILLAAVEILRARKELPGPRGTP